MYDLIPRNKNVNSFSIDGFSWPLMLNEGVGLIIGAMEGVNPSTDIYELRKGCNPYGNDGFRVTSKEAWAMAKAARNLVSGYRYIQKIWDEFSDEEKEWRYENNKNLHNFKYKEPVNEEFLEKVLSFADFAEKSGGFTIE